mmetsp:Transcript_9676/g.25827  ORF Transcript_9676/g.25827 Transcript_9676/m.25827 type:complete len:423 (-) Transcript_9676:2747-4015(-)
MINVLMRHYSEQIDTVCIQHPLLLGLVRSGVRIDDGPIRLAHEYLANRRNAAETQVRQQSGFNLAQEQLVRLLILIVSSNPSFDVIGLPTIRVCFDGVSLAERDANSKHKIIVVVFARHDVQIVPKLQLNCVLDVIHANLAISQHLFRQYNAKEPRAHFVIFFIKHEVTRNQLLVLLDDGVLRIGVVVYLCALRHVPQVCVLQLRLDLFCSFRIISCFTAEVYGERGCLWIFGYVDDLFQARHAKRHVFGGHASKVKGVKGHLRGWLSDALRCDGTNHFPGSTSCIQKTVFNLSQHVFECSTRQSVLRQHLSGAQRRTNVDLEEQRRVNLRLLGQSIHHVKMLASQIPHSFLVLEVVLVFIGTQPPIWIFLLLAVLVDNSTLGELWNHNEALQHFLHAAQNFARSQVRYAVLSNLKHVLCAP